MSERLRTISVGDCELDINHDMFINSIHSEPSLMNTSQISTSSQDSHRASFSKTPHQIASRGVGTSACRFPKLEECAHFHYERVQLGKILIRLIDDRPESLIVAGSASQLTDGINSQAAQHWFIIKVSAGRSEPFLIKRSLQNLKMLDEMLHRCVYDRRISDLQELNDVDNEDDEELEDIVSIYLSRLSSIASDAMTCGPVLTWLQLDNKGRRLPVADTDTMLTINTPAVGAAYGVRRYVAQACDEISIEVGDMISVIDMPSPAESVWWRGKKSHLQKNQYEVGFFPQSCVATIGEKVPRHMQLPAPLVGSLALSPTKPVLRKHGKLITFFRSFILARPSRRRLKQSGIYKERVFSCDLGEHLLNSVQDIPMVLKCCAEFIEEFGIVDGIYRLSGITSNIQKLRRAFDEERIPDLSQPDIKQDIHAVSSLLKMYFRELPNPLCTYQLYDNFVEAIQARTEIDDLRLKLIKQTVRKLPPPHYRTLKYLACHLFKIAKHSSNTGMTERNIAIVWAPNLLRSPALESGGVAALRGVGVQAVVTEYLICNCEQIFDDTNDDFDYYNTSQPASLSDTSSIHIEAREISLSMIERPKSLGIGPPKLISLEEAQIRKTQREIELKNAIPNIPVSTHNPSSSYIEVGGGPSSLPDKYHTVLPVPRSWNKRKTNSWKSIFQRGPRGGSNNNIKSNRNSTTSSSAATKETPSKKDTSERKERSRKELPVILSAGSSNNSSFKENKLTKSADMLDTGKSMNLELSCVRSCSIDSLRTAGHSRSVSHDSYFDLLQSPLRGMTTCPSRELSELGINFDREEPEMRIFSESESLVSSPKVAAKESITRRVLRARPEEYSSTANNVNPSPKKQPRLNLQSPSDLKTWATIISENSLETNESSSCKRYKLEDQLSDIQFIDCNTPEHSSLAANVANNVNTGYTIYTTIQIHNPPASLYEEPQPHKVIIDTENTVPQRTENSERYSYPVTQYSSYATKDDHRFSYPIISSADLEKESFKENDKNNENIYQMAVCAGSPAAAKKTNAVDQLGRYSYTADGVNQESQLPRCNSAAADCYKKSEMNKSKLSVATPQSPMKSPCYSLLIGSTTSSDSSSTAANTPTYDMDICSQYYEPISFNAKELECGATTSNNNRDNIVVMQTNSFEKEDKVEAKKDMRAIKKELSLDLMTRNNRNVINVPSSPSTPQNQTTASDNTATTNTSQSITPSEIGYQNLFTRQLTPDLSPRVEDTYAFVVKPTIVCVSSPIHEKPVKTSPIKSTISITYNLKSPTKSENEEGQCFFPENFQKEDEDQKDGLLETSFDESMVYEQVKFFKNVVSQVNDMVDETSPLEDLDHKIDFPEESGDEHKEENAEEHYEMVFNTGNEKLVVNDIFDVHMMDHELLEEPKPDYDLDQEDSLEFDPNISMYENVDLRHPAKVYENVQMPTSLNSSPIRQAKVSFDSKYTMDEFESDYEARERLETKNQSPNSVSNVKKLANRFETSPVDIQPAFDFNKAANRRSEFNFRTPEVIMRKNSKNSDTYSITRSLDENAFIREFGSARKFEEFNKSINEIAEMTSLSSGSQSSRRKSIDYSKPKTLNPPKKLPGQGSHIPDKHELCRRSISDTDGSHKLKLNICDPKDLTDDDGLLLNDRINLQSFNVRITPTTENRISLIQNNFETGLVNSSIKQASDDEKSTSTTSLSSMKLLKLDRERIEKIKEERRHQLNEKYRSESFRNVNNNNPKLQKPKAEICIDDLSDEMSLVNRFKSKSRNDMLNSMDNEQPYSLITTTSSSTNNLTNNRVRRISDEKNQNDVMEAASELPESVILRNKDAGVSEARDGKFEVKSRPKFDKKTFEFARERGSAGSNYRFSQNPPQSDRYSPQISIKDVAAMFESRSSSHQHS